MSMRRTCPMCGAATFTGWHCGLDLSAPTAGWRMGRRELRAVHVLALVVKGLDEETYRLRLGAVGVDSSKQFSRRQFFDFMAGLRTLPDAPGQPMGRQHG